MLDYFKKYSGKNSKGLEYTLKIITIFSVFQKIYNYLFNLIIFNKKLFVVLFFSNNYF